MEALSADLLSREESRIEHSYVQCECDHFQRPLWFKLLTGALLGLMASLGIFVMVSSVRGAFSE